MKHFKNLYAQQHGVVLVAGLILLLIITMLGISSMQSVSLSEKMAANTRDNNLAFHAAESALSDAEQWIRAQPNQPDAVPTCTTSPCNVWQLDQLGSFTTRTHAWWQANARPFSSTLVGLNTQPRFIVEQYGFVPNELSPDARAKGMGYHFYRITARGTGSVDTSQVIMQSIFTTQFN